jgi:hypothetical protein
MLPVRSIRLIRRARLRVAVILAFAVVLSSCSSEGTISSGSSAVPAAEGPGRQNAALDLTYASTDRGVEWYKFPGARIHGVISGGDRALGMCRDAKSNVYIAYGVDILEFPHASDKYSTEWKSGAYISKSCAVDPTNSDLAVVNTETTTHAAGNIAIYAGGSSTPTYYTLSNITNPAFASYDSNGNLFVDGTTAGGAFALAELPAGESTFKPVTLKHAISVPGGVEWDGNRLAIGDGSHQSSKIYRVAVTNFVATVKSSVSLTSTTGLLQFDVFKKRIVVASLFPPSVSYYAYPHGGSASKTIQVSDAYGVVVSPADPPVSRPH